MREELARISGNYPYRTSSEIAIRCPFCGDSTKSLHEGHLYIKVEAEGTNGLAYFPFNCKQKNCAVRRRVMRIDDAERIGIRNAQLLEYIAHVGKIVSHSVKAQTQVSRASPFYFSYTSNLLSETLMQRKLAYLYRRLGNKSLCVSYPAYKIVLDVRSFFKANKLDLNTDYYDVKERLTMLHEQAIGFVSFANTHIIFRDITGTLERRYTLYTIYSRHIRTLYDDELKTSSIYIIPTTINSMSSSLSLIMAEGVFDILRAYFDFYKGDSINRIFVAVGNAEGYRPCIAKLLEYGIMVQDITIYSDSDVDLVQYKKYVRTIIPKKTIPITVYYNTAYKDIGDIQKPLQLTHFIL